MMCLISVFTGWNAQWRQGSWLDFCSISSIQQGPGNLSVSLVKEWSGGWKNVLTSILHLVNPSSSFRSWLPNKVFLDSLD